MTSAAVLLIQSDTEYMIKLCKVQSVKLVFVWTSIYLRYKLLSFCSKNNGAVMEIFHLASVHLVRGAMCRRVVASDSACVCVWVHMST